MVTKLLEDPAICLNGICYTLDMEPKYASRTDEMECEGGIGLAKETSHKEFPDDLSEYIDLREDENLGCKKATSNEATTQRLKCSLTVF